MREWNDDVGGRGECRVERPRRHGAIAAAPRKTPDEGHSATKMRVNGRGRRCPTIAAKEYGANAD